MTAELKNQLQLVEPTPDYLGNKIRVLVDELNNNAPWFVASDLIKAFGARTTHTWNAANKLDPCDRSTYSISKGVRPMLIVSEPGFYELVLGSRKPGAVAFKRWVCSEVLPAIRQYGRYEALATEDGEPVDVPEVMVEMVNLTKRLPNGDISENAQRVHIWEYVEVFGIEMDRNQRAALGKIARRLLLTYDLPILSKWGALNSRHWSTVRGGRVYPLAILDMAYQEFLSGRKD